MRMGLSLNSSKTYNSRECFVCLEETHTLIVAKNHTPSCPECKALGSEEEIRGTWYFVREYTHRIAPWAVWGLQPPKQTCPVIQEGLAAELLLPPRHGQHAVLTWLPSQSKTKFWARGRSDADTKGGLASMQAWIAQDLDYFPFCESRVQMPSKMNVKKFQSRSAFEE